MGDPRVLTQRALNRAVLARQGLLDRYRCSLPVAVERMGGVQAQYAPSSYVGLWSRLDGFRGGDLDGGLQRRTVVQATLMRATIHVVSARDFWPVADAIRGPRLAWWLRVQRTGLGADELRAAADRGVAALRAGPLDQAELDGVLDQPARYAVGMHADLVRVPPAGTWAHRRADRFALAEDWLSPPAPTGDPVEHLVRRYLGAFGPAHRSDVATWAGIKVRDLAPALDRMTLRRFRAEDGAELLDLPRAPLPDPERPAPVRFLPTWDAILLTHCRRAGVLPEEHRSAIFSTRNPFSVGTVLVDGQVRATWRPVDGRIEVSELERLGRADRAAVAAETAALEDFHRATDTELGTATTGATGRAASRRRPGPSRR
jgi:hypothetical protein